MAGAGEAAVPSLVVPPWWASALSSEAQLIFSPDLIVRLLRPGLLLRLALHTPATGLSVPRTSQVPSCLCTCLLGGSAPSDILT